MSVLEKSGFYDITKSPDDIEVAQLRGIIRDVEKYLMGARDDTGKSLSMRIDAFFYGDEQ